MVKPVMSKENCTGRELLRDVYFFKGYTHHHRTHDPGWRAAASMSFFQHEWYWAYLYDEVNSKLWLQVHSQVWCTCPRGCFQSLAEPWVDTFSTLHVKWGICPCDMPKEVKPSHSDELWHLTWESSLKSYFRIGRLERYWYWVIGYWAIFTGIG